MFGSGKGEEKKKVRERTVRQWDVECSQPLRSEGLCLCAGRMNTLFCCSEIHRWPRRKLERDVSQGHVGIG